MIILHLKFNYFTFKIQLFYYIFHRYTYHNETMTGEMGYAAYYSNEDLKKQQKLSKEIDKSYIYALNKIIEIALKYKQTYVTLYYPHSFGLTDNTLEPYKYTNIIQEIIPTRTGLHEIKSSVVVWLSEINDIKMIQKSNVYRTDGVSVDNDTAIDEKWLNGN